MSPAERPPSLNVVGEQITVLASGAQTGSFEIFFQAGPEPAGPPPHSHEWDESFYVLKGEVDFGFDGDTRTAGSGTLVVIPGGTVHWFRLGADGAEMLSITSRAGASALFTELDAKISPDAPDLATLVEVATAHGLTVALPADAPADA